MGHLCDISMSYKIFWICKKRVKMGNMNGLDNHMKQQMH